MLKNNFDEGFSLEFASEKAIELFERTTLKGKTVLDDLAFSYEKIRD